MPSRSENTWQSFIPCLYSRSFVAFSDRIRAFIIAHKMATFLSNTFPSSQMNAQEEDAKSPPSRGGPEKEDKVNTNNHYETLLVSTFASDEEIRRAYLKLALRCHPDKFGRRRRQQEEEEEDKEEEAVVLLLLLLATTAVDELPPVALVLTEECIQFFNF